jgi:hypothetical protein
MGVINMKSNRIWIILPLIAVLFILTGCTGSPAQSDAAQQTVQAAVAQTLTAAPTATLQPTGTATPIPTPTASPTPQIIQVGPTNFPAGVDPLTGLTVGDPSILNRRPVMIKVSNYPRTGRPHAGLSSADIVFDYYIGEGGNRFLAVFYGQDSTKVGPIRSGRLVDRFLVREYQGILGLIYAYPPEYAKILDMLGFSRTISGGPNTCPAICSDGPETVTSRFANTAEMTKLYESRDGASNTKPNLDGMAFNTTPPANGVAATEFTMQFSRANLGQWKYDASTKKYLRWIEDEDTAGNVTLVPLTDRNTGSQLAFSNVIVVYANYETLNGDDTIHEITISGANGKAVFFRDGQMYEGVWKNTNLDTPLQFFNKDNQPFELQPGNTWINIVGLNSLLSQDQPGIYKVIFGKP